MFRAKPRCDAAEAAIWVIILLLAFTEDSDCQTTGGRTCQCVNSKSKYLTTAALIHSTTPMSVYNGTNVTTITTMSADAKTSTANAAINVTTASSRSSTVTSSGTARTTPAGLVTTRIPAGSEGSTVESIAATSSTTATVTTTTPKSLENATQLAAMINTRAYELSAPGYTYNDTTNFFTIPANATEARIVIDLRIGPTGAICRPMPNLTQICITSYCAGCNLNKFTAAGATTVTGGASDLNQRIFYPTEIVNTTVCAGRDAFKDVGDFRYIVFLATGSPSPSQPFAFKISLDGTFQPYNCPPRRRRSLDTMDTSSTDGRSSDMFHHLSRSRRAVPNDCSCQVGQDPVFASVRIVRVSWIWVLPRNPFTSSLANNSSLEYSSLAIESYYLVMTAIRNISISNLTSVVADFFDIEFSPVRIGPSGSGRQLSAGQSDPANSTRLDAKLSVRNDSYFSEAYLQEQLRALPLGYNSSIANLTVSPLTLESATTVSTGTGTTLSNAQASNAFPAYAIAIICVLGVAAVVGAMVLVWWHRQRRLKALNPPNDYLYDSLAEFSSVVSVNGRQRGSDAVDDASYVNLAAFRLDPDALQPSAGESDFGGQQ